MRAHQFYIDPSLTLLMGTNQGQFAQHLFHLMAEKFTGVVICIVYLSLGERSEYRVSASHLIREVGFCSRGDR